MYPVQGPAHTRARGALTPGGVQVDDATFRCHIRRLVRTATAREAHGYQIRPAVHGVEALAGVRQSLREPTIDVLATVPPAV